MRLLLDSTVLIDHLRGDQRAYDLLRSAARQGDELWSVVVVRTELLAGMRPGEEQATYGLLRRLRWADVTVGMADLAGDLARRYLRSHRAIDTVDYLIAAVAQVLGAELKTLNVRHFPMIQSLAPAY